LIFLAKATSMPSVVCGLAFICVDFFWAG
jgi:hypothetical protein